MFHKYLRGKKVLTLPYKYNYSHNLLVTTPKQIAFQAVYLKKIKALSQVPYKNTEYICGS